MIGLGIGIPFQSAGLDLRMLWPTGTEPGGWWSLRGANLAAATQSPTVAYQESTGVTQAVAIADPLGLWLDRRKGLVLGPELVTNPGGPFTVTTGYAASNSTLSIVGGRLRATATGASDVGAQWDLTGLVAGKTYVVQVQGYVGTEGSLVALGGLGLTGESAVVTQDGTLTCSVIASLTTGRITIRGTGGSVLGNYIEVGNFSVKLLDGLHLSQATAAARPLKHARVNRATMTRSFGADWSLVNTGTGVAPTKTPNYGVAPDGTTTACRMQLNKGAGTTATDVSSIANAASGAAVASVNSAWVRSTDGASSYNITLHTNSGASSVVAVTGTWAQVKATPDNGWGVNLCFSLKGNVTANATADILVWQPQTEFNSTGVPTRYQWCDTATSYDTVGFPVFAKHDGVDDGMASAAVAAGGAGNSNMDCFILVRRNSAAASVPIRSDLDSRYVGYYDSTATTGTPTLNSGASSSYQVDGAALPSGAASTPAQLNTALTVGAWHVMEIHNIDMSLWGGLGLSTYVGGAFKTNADIAEIVLCPAQSDARRAQIRRYMATYPGVSIAL